MRTMKTKGCRVIAALVAAALIASVLSPYQPALAGMVTTEQVVESAGIYEDRARVQAYLDRDEVRRQIEALGVDPGEAAARIDTLSDAEIAEIADRIDRLPAGQDAVGAIVGAALLVFIVLLITDILGYTDVFPFVQSAGD